jgi:hypothetical protein
MARGPAFHCGFRALLGRAVATPLSQTPERRAMAAERRDSHVVMFSAGSARGRPPSASSGVGPFQRHAAVRRHARRGRRHLPVPSCCRAQRRLRTGHGWLMGARRSRSSTTTGSSATSGSRTARSTSSRSRAGSGWTRTATRSGRSSMSGSTGRDTPSARRSKRAGRRTRFARR